MAAPARRIDGLYCTSATAQARIEAICRDVETRAAAVRKEVSEAVAERVKKLQEREKELLEQIKTMAAAKVEVLKAQMSEIARGTCAPAPADEGAASDSDRFMIRVDAVIAFKLGEQDFVEKIPEFGMIGESSTYASLTYANGPALGVLKMDNASYLWVYSCDRNGVRRTEGGNPVIAQFSSPSDFDGLEVEDLKDGRYKIKFVPRTSGVFTLDVSVDSENSVEAIRGSPFTLNVQQPTDYTLYGKDVAVDGKRKIGDLGEPYLADKMGCVHHPSGVDFDEQGKYIFMVDQSNHRVQVFDVEDGKAVSVFGSKGFGVQEFDTPCDIVVDRFNRTVVSDLLNHRLQLLQFNARTHQLEHVRYVGGQGSGPGQFEFPKGIAFSEDGHVIICDAGNHRVQVLDVNNDFKFVREFGSCGGGEGQFVSPLDAAVNSSGEIIVSDSNNRIQVFDSEGVYQRCFGYGKGQKDLFFDYPTNLTVNDENALFICDQGNHRVQVLDASDGRILHSWRGYRKKPVEGAEEDEDPPWVGIKKPAGIAVNTHGTVIVSDYFFNVMFEF